MKGTNRWGSSSWLTHPLVWLERGQKPPQTNGMNGERIRRGRLWNVQYSGLSWSGNGTMGRVVAFGTRYQLFQVRIASITSLNIYTNCILPKTERNFSFKKQITDIFLIGKDITKFKPTCHSDSDQSYGQNIIARLNSECYFLYKKQRLSHLESSPRISSI